MKYLVENVLTETCFYADLDPFIVYKLLHENLTKTEIENLDFELSKIDKSSKENIFIKMKENDHCENGHEYQMEADTFEYDDEGRAMGYEYTYMSDEFEGCPHCKEKAIEDFGYEHVESTNDYAIFLKT